MGKEQRHLHSRNHHQFVRPSVSLSICSPAAFFIFSKFCLSGLLGGGGVKRAKNGPKWQKILSHSVSQELHLIWLWFLVHMCKMMISPAICFIFSKIWFFWVFQSSSINAKMKFCVSHPPHVCDFFIKRNVG